MCNLITLIFFRDILHVHFFTENEQILPGSRIVFQNLEIRTTLVYEHENFMHAGFGDARSRDHNTRNKNRKKQFFYSAILSLYVKRPNVTKSNL